MSTAIAKAEPGIVSRIKNEINRELGDAETLKSLLDTTFRGFEAPMMKRALLEGMLRGFSFEDFLKKNVYAIPYGGGYSLVTSIDYSRKIAQRSGIIGSPKQEWELDSAGKPISCTVTVQKKVGDTIGDFSATVFFDEFNTGKNQWKDKPKHMIGKVSEMHALRKAFPEELAQTYVEEELQEKEITKIAAIDTDALKIHEDTLLHFADLEGLDRYWADLPVEYKTKLKSIYEGQRAILKQESADIV